MRKLLLIACAVVLSNQIQAQTVTWAQDIAPILYANCTKCHNPNGAGHFSLLTYSEAYAYGFLMASYTSDGTMPPWPPNENYKHFVHERTLPQTDIDKISDWVNGGRLQGDVTQAPAQPTYSTGSTLGTVDLSVIMPTYTVTTNSDIYRNFPIATNVPAGSYITAMEVVPGNHHAVHHVLVFQDSTNVPAQLDANQPGPGYSNTTTGSVSSRLIGAWVPGASPYYTPVGTGFRMAANTNIVVQVHYPAGSQGEMDSTRINFKVTTIPQRDITTWPLVNNYQNMTNGPINIPANTTKTYYEQYNVNTNYTFLSASPHMHLVGTSIKSWANKTTAPFDTIRFVDIPNWDFYWQDNYIFPNAVKIPSGYKIQAVATYDNTTNNIYNPSTPPQTVVAGEATTDEMMMVFFAYMPYISGDENLIIDRRVIPQGATTICNGQSVVLKTIEGTGYTYQWYRNGVSIGSATASAYTATQAGNYHVLISLGPNSSNSDTIPVSVVSTPVASISPSATAVFCPGSSVMLHAGVGNGYSYQWLKNGTPLSGATGSMYVVSDTGHYTLQVYNTCYAQSSPVAVTQGSFPSATVTPSGPTTFCQGGNVTLSAPAGLSYHWNTGANSQSISVSQAGNYAVTVTDGNNCQAGSTITSVTVNNLPTGTITADQGTSLCQGEATTLNVYNVTGLGFQWSTGSTNSYITVAQTGSYDVTLTDANGCHGAVAPINVTVHPLPSVTITAGGATSFCPGGSVLFTASSGSAYSWNTGATSQSITASQQGTYTVTVTDANNCSNTYFMGVTVYSLPDATITSNHPTTICPGSDVTLSGPGGMSYGWSTGSHNQSITVSAAGSYTLTVTDAHNCQSTSVPAVVTISNNPVAGITTSGNTTFCQGQSVQLTASAGTSYLWSTNETTASITVNTAGNYSVTVTESGSCTAVSNPLTITVNQPPAAPIINTGGPTSICAGGQVALYTDQGFSYNWSNGSTDYMLMTGQAGTYTLTITDANGCTAVSAPVTVTVNTPPAAFSINHAGPVTFCHGGSVDLSAPAGYSYSWNNGDSVQTIHVTETGGFMVTITDANSCTRAATAGVSVTVTPAPMVTLPGGLAAICNSAAPITLAGESPTGGTYSGNGVAGNTFDPASAGLGVVTITYDYTDNNNCSNSATETIEVTNCTGIVHLQALQFSLLPNPNDGNFVLTVSDVSINTSVAIFDVAGKLVYSNTIEKAVTPVSLANVAAGCYLLQLSSGKEVVHKKLIIQ